MFLSSIIWLITLILSCEKMLKFLCKSNDLSYSQPLFLNSEVSTQVPGKSQKRNKAQRRESAET